VDAPYGNLNGQGNCVTGAVLAPGASYTCSFTAPVQGAAGDEVIDTVTATATGPGGIQLSANDLASVAILPAAGSALVVSKKASPTILGEPGGNVTFTVTILNTGAETLQLTALSDSVFGDLNGRGNCATGAVMPPGGSYNCSFQAPVNGQAPLLHLDTVTATATAPGGVLVYDSARALVFIIAGSAVTPVDVPVASFWLLLAVAGVLGTVARRASRR
jgi:hypothetical protein